MASPSTLAALREQIRKIERPHAPLKAVLPFEVADLDARLPGGGLSLAALHEIAPGGRDFQHAAAATLFTAGIGARSGGRILWCLRQADLFAPALAGVGLDADRLITVEAPDEVSLLSCFEEGLRHGSLSAVVAEVSRLTMTASRRLQLAAEKGHTLGLVLRRARTRSQADSFSQPSAAITRWRVSALPSEPLPVPGVGRARWQVDLVRCRAGEPATFEVEACDEAGRLSLVSRLADGMLPATYEKERRFG